MENNCHIPDLIQDFLFVENVEFHLVFLASSTSYVFDSCIRFQGGDSIQMFEDIKVNSINCNRKNTRNEIVDSENGKKIIII